MNIKAICLFVGLSAGALGCGAPADDGAADNGTPADKGAPANEGGGRTEAEAKYSITAVTVDADGNPVVRKSFHTAAQMAAKKEAKANYLRARAEGLEMQPSPSEDGCEWWYLWMWDQQYTEGNMCCAWAPDGPATRTLSTFCGFDIRSYYSGDQPGEFKKYLLWFSLCNDPFGTNELSLVADCQPSTWLGLYP